MEDVDMDTRFAGIFPALLTPFDTKDRINIDVINQMIEYNTMKGVNGFYVCGSTAEVFLLSEEERIQIMKAVSEAANHSCTLIAHIGCVSTKQAIKLAEKAKELGYHAISSVAPFYYKFSFEEIKKYYYDIVQCVDLPMLVYNFPVNSGVNLSVSNIGEFLSDDRFIGIKHTSSDYFALSLIKEAFPDKIILNGYDETFLAGLAMGADGAIGSTFNFMAEKFVSIRNLFLQNRINEAQAIQRDANIIIQALCEVGVMQGEKIIMEELGFKLGNARSPFSIVSDSERQKLLNTVIPLL